ncbi:hypothetical protein LEP1GSC083_2986 [Leptospira interrogans serovar Pyrogenes str. L0374]|uniref:Uncharacterized protein n=1 Tax=Leptospira interrogans serovar Pyrogenes str. L0374 TaxID=1049928 RepID=M6KV01_LEPIR|nr:hypothetical protein LEP1GSC077_0292 [Leptospira interrogans str. C10069]EMN31647.1 hypothetical protein LEP1GSC083_2986 [Leptospira interrogans serovar Pyrogenes str. L0374]EMN54322.1 hypothetical protein LEP1GSC089_3619 [Leptospira interrogans serovar Autumnalis str. LP101]EMN82945.1 hypothetical protein LEP1GSC106_1271 [Leptospira interrogans serovar Grippotyphosa str. UI 12764]
MKECSAEFPTSIAFVLDYTENALTDTLSQQLQVINFLRASKMILIFLRYP